MEGQEKSCAHVGMEVAQGKGFSATLAKEDLAKDLQPLPTSPELWASRKYPLSTDEAKLRQCKLGASCWVAAVSRPDICARLARRASRITALCGSDVYRNNELAREAGEWQHATVLKCASSSHPLETLGLGGGAGVDLCSREEKVHSGPASSVGWSDATFGGQLTEGKRRSGRASGLM